MVEGCLDLGMSRLELSRLKGGVGRDDISLLLAWSGRLPWLRTDGGFAGRTGDIAGAFEGPTVCSRALGSCFILTLAAAVLEATEARGRLGLDFGGFTVGTRAGD